MDLRKQKGEKFMKNMKEKEFWPVEKRKANIEQTLRILKSMGRIEYVKAVAVLCINSGLRREKVVEYLTILRDAESIKIEKGFIEPLMYTHIQSKKQEGTVT